MMSLSDDKQALILLMLLTPHPDIWTIFQTLIMCSQSNIPFRAQT